MVNEDIITSLKNAISKGETLDSAMQTAVASGYNARDVQDASHYIGSGIVHMEKASQDRMLTMPNQKKGLFSGLFSKKQPEQLIQYQSQSSQIPPSPQYNTNRAQTQSQDMSFSSIPLPAQTKQPIINAPIPKPIPIQKLPQQQPQQIQRLPPQLPQQSYPQPYSYPPQKTPKKQSYVIEIILLIMLIILAAILIITFRYRNQIVAFFSG